MALRVLVDATDVPTDRGALGRYVDGLICALSSAGADLAGTDSPLEALAETFGDGAWLLVLDNLEQAVQVAPDLGELLARCPGLVMLATSRTVLGLRG